MVNESNSTDKPQAKPTGGKPGETGYPQYEHGADNNAVNPKQLYDLNQDSRSPDKASPPAEDPLQRGITDQGGNGSQDRRPGAGRRSNRAAAGLVYDSSVLLDEDRPR